jgi:hypothetical protein
MTETPSTNPRSSPHSASTGVHLHAPGDGFHLLPAHEITGRGLRPLTSESCVLLLFTMWAAQRDLDAVAIHAQAYPDDPMLRPDQLLTFRQWLDPACRNATVDSDLLILDLTDINQHALAATIRAITSGHYAPPGAFTHWVVDQHGRIGGEARDLDPPDGSDDQGQYFCFVRLFAMPDMAEWGYTDAVHLRRKSY